MLKTHASRLRAQVNRRTSERREWIAQLREHDLVISDPRTMADHIGAIDRAQAAGGAGCALCR